MNKKILRPIILLLIFILVMSNLNGIVLASRDSFEEWIDTNKTELDKIADSKGAISSDASYTNMFNIGYNTFQDVSIEGLDSQLIDKYLKYAKIIRDKSGLYGLTIFTGDAEQKEEFDKKITNLEALKSGKKIETSTDSNSNATAKIPSHWKEWPSCLPRDVEDFQYFRDGTNDTVFEKVCKMYINAVPDPVSESETNDTIAKQWVKQIGEIMKQPGMSSYLQYSGAGYKNQIVEKMRNIMKKRDISSDKEVKKVFEENGATIDNDGSKTETSESIYKYPGQDQNKTSAAGSLDDMIGDADKFIDNAEDSPISTSSLQNFSKTFYNIFLTVGIIIAVLVGSILGIKFMIGGAEEKAHIKELLVPYVVGCIVIFGAFAIWKIVVTILGNSFL